MILTVFASFSRPLLFISNQTGPEFYVERLSRAVLQRSEDDVVRLLHENPRAVFEEATIHGYTPLHLAFDWPHGLRLLLTVGQGEMANKADKVGFVPLLYAAAQANVGSMKILLEYGTWRFDRQVLYDDDYQTCESLLLEGVLNTNSAAAIEIAVRAIAAKRQGLYDFACEHLSSSLMTQFIMPAGHVLDAAAREIYDVLVKAGIDVPDRLKIHHKKGTVYHIRQNGPETADVLWEAGFRDIDSPDFRGDVPLVKWCLDPDPEVSRIDWLLRKNARFEAPAPCADDDWHAQYAASISFWHCVAAGFRDEAYIVFTEHSDLFASVWSATNTDVCRCACSTSGCSPLGFLVRTTGKCKLCMLERINDHMNLTQEAFMDIVRIFTFDALGLTHTCCELTSPWKIEPSEMHGINPICTDSSEVDEIHDEERILIGQFGQLMSEFQDLLLLREQSLTDSVRLSTRPYYGG